MAVKMISGLLGSNLKAQKILLIIIIGIILFSYTDRRRGRLFLLGALCCNIPYIWLAMRAGSQTRDPGGRPSGRISNDIISVASKHNQQLIILHTSIELFAELATKW
jgi:hypothetical protein